MPGGGLFDMRDNASCHVKGSPMTVENPRAVDFVSIDHESGTVVLTIADHLPWDEGDAHLMTLQEKLNAYLAFIESGELVKSAPEAAGRKVRIALVHREPLTAAAVYFLTMAQDVVREAGFELTWQHLPG
jgi:hypothetical protein